MPRATLKAENLFRLGLFLLLAFLGLFHLHTRIELKAEKQRSEHLVGQRLSTIADRAVQELNGSPWEPLKVAERLADLKERLQIHEISLLNRPQPGGDSPSGPALRSGLAPSQEEEAWSGATVLSPIFRDEAGSLLKAVWVPLGEAPSGTQHILRIAVRLPENGNGQAGTVTGFLLKVFGGVGAVVLIYYGMRSAVLGMRSTGLSHRERSQPNLSGPAEPEKSEAGQDKAEFVIDTFQDLIRRLKEKEEELEQLRKVAEERADHMEHYNENILRSVSSGVITFSQKAVVTTFNQAAERILDLPAPSAIGRTCQEVFGPDSQIHHLVQSALHRKEMPVRQEMELVCPAPEGSGEDGQRRPRRIWAGMGTSLLSDKQGQIIGMTMVFTDLTEIKQLQEQMELQKRLTLLGEVSAGIAHEFRNYMGTILGYAKLLAKKVGTEHTASDMTQAIIHEVEEMEKLIRELLSFSRQPDLNLQAVDLNRLLERIIRQTFEQSKRPPPKLTLSLSPLLDKVLLDEVLIRQALGNIIQNAVEAMPLSGELSVRTGPVSSKPSRQQNGKPIADSTHAIEIEIQDTGVGMSPEVQARVFMPLFTTKEAGTGMGMALSHKIILSHHGQIRVESEEGKGTTFRIYLPIVKESSHTL